ncbi:hypothetical protein ES705_24893 [subsurface metagenome]|nr:MAG: hypothetical protein ES695_16165 [Candidatus Atribacteria bacterium 1244-E10-H5-B2]
MKTTLFKIGEIPDPKKGFKPGFLVMREVGNFFKEAICKELDKLEANTVLEIDFTDVRFMDISCADEIVVKVLARLEAGEFPERFIVLSHIEEQHRENIGTALIVRKKAIIVKEEDGWSLLGELVDSHRKALFKVMESKSITSRKLQEKMGYKEINEASSKLVILYKRCLIAHFPYRKAVRGGGRQFEYLSLLHNEGGG